MVQTVDGVGGPGAKAVVTGRAGGVAVKGRQIGLGFLGTRFVDRCQCGSLSKKPKPYLSP